MNTYLVALYTFFVVLVCINILVNTETPSKALGYLLLVISFPVIGIIIYLSVGLNYRKKELYRKKLKIDELEYPKLEKQADALSRATLMNLPAASGRGIMMDYLFYFSPQEAGNSTQRD